MVESLTQNYKKIELGCQNYKDIWQNMHDFVNSDVEKENEVWILEHFPVFTQGVSGKEEHILQKSTQIPIIKTDRGGQATYHAPGQLIIYPLIHLDRTNITFRKVITALEESTVEMLKKYNIGSYADPKKPGVYIEGRKIASVGLRVKNGWVTRGLAINVDINLKPFEMIVPCGIKNLQMTRCADINGPKSVQEAAKTFMPIFDEKIQRSIIK